MSQRFGRLIFLSLLAIGIANGLASQAVAQDSVFDHVARALLGGSPFRPRLLTADDAPIQVSRDQLQIGVTNAYDPSGIRYLAIRLRVQNRSGKALKVQSDQCQILLGNEVAPRVTQASQLNEMPVALIGEDNEGDPVALQGPGEFSVAPGKFRTTWMIFAPLPPARDLPAIQLQLKTSQGPIEIDLTKQEESRLRVESERIGPKGCVKVCRVTGDLNILNLRNLVDQMSLNPATGLVISFQQGAQLRDPLIEEWLVDGDEAADNERLKYLPMWPALRQSAVIVGLPGQYDESSETLASTESQAVRMVTRRLIPQLDSATLRQELRSGHPDFRLAILQDHGDLVAQVEPAALLTALEDLTSSPELRLALIQSLRSIADPKAVGVLEQFCRTGSREEATQALRSLNVSAQATARTKAIELARDPDVRKRIGLPMILRSVGVEVDTAWLPFLYEAFASDDPLARDLALQHLLSQGISDRRPILSQAFSDRSADVRESAYQAIVGQRADDEQSLFEEETFRRFRAGMRDRNTLAGIGELRDPQAIPELLKSIDAESGDVSTLVECCLSLGGNDVLPELEKRFAKLPSNSQLEILRVMHERGLDEARNLAIAHMAAPDDELRTMCLYVLVSIGDTSCYEAIRSHLVKHADDNIGQEAIRVVGQSLTPESRKLLTSLAGEQSPELRRLARLGLDIQATTHPNFNWREVATDLTNDGQFDAAIEALKLAVETDDQDWFTINNLGYAYLQRSRPAEALPWFQRSQQINPEAHSSLTGVAICLAVEGKIDEAIRMVDRPELLDRWGTEQLYVYNIACVYGRSIEYLAKQPAMPETEKRLRELEDRAIEFLKKSFDQGFQDSKLFESDPDLNSLRNLPAFQELVKRMQGLNS